MDRLLATLTPYWLWVLLSLPAAAFLFAASSSNDPKIYDELLHPTGEFSARFMIVAMMATPLSLLFKNSHWPRWLLKNRRYFGVAAFGYALIHTLLYILDAKSLNAIVSDAPEIAYWTGWLAFLIFIPLAATSNYYFVRLLGTRWNWTGDCSFWTIIGTRILSSVALVKTGPQMKDQKLFLGHENEDQESLYPGDKNEPNVDWRNRILSHCE